MKFYRVIVPEKQHELLLESLGDSCDNAVDDASEREFDYLFDVIKKAESFEADDIPAESSSKDKAAVDRAGNELLYFMRQLVKCEEVWSSNDVEWYTHELSALIRGIALAGWNVNVKPQSKGIFRCVEIEGMIFEV